ncbi:winged helix DNA-binding protein [Noviherbaspirillum sp.]|uniref:winged helix DNA-binding protein n=1 Tax=Noviherbaspirillum sp. TaxID=1926288 RepID=UPI002FDF9C85
MQKPRGSAQSTDPVRKNCKLQGAAGSRLTTIPGTKSAALDELDIGIVGVMQAFQRWIVSAMADAGIKDLVVTDALVLDQLNGRAHAKSLADICFILNIEDARVVGYSLRKLVALDVVSAEKRGKEVIFSITPLGQAYLLRYQEVREHRLLDTLVALGPNKSVYTALSQYLRKLSGLYDQAARAASSL